ncbi:hypothetical protein F383_12287 [Gossypium arboreum]|uniref:Uncharacterized protein n=1 Tax=Gossypium arboreum TaxID=29729 RepID=A0A0B0NAE2_GOSAR|nr:hypothetical protein F383_12287 [Gossypium arboreum]
MSKLVSSSIASVTCYKVALATYVYVALMCMYAKPMNNALVKND